MADCLISPVKEIAKCILTQCVWPPIKSHVDYWWCFNSNIQCLRDGIDKLERKKGSIEQEIERARLLTHIPCPEVEEWLKASTEKLAEARGILQDDNIPGAWDIRSRYSLGKNAKETAEQITKLLNDGDLIQIAYPPPPAAMASPPLRSNMDFESRKGIEEDIIKSLTESSVDMIGICGMGGVGKTTMAQRIWKRVKDENLFDEVVMVTVSQQIDMPKIQSEIAELLKLKFVESSMPARAHQLRTRLMDAKRKIIILDDVWESLRFEDLGIPIEGNSERCKVLLTSRSRDTCKRIKNKKVFELKILEEEEAWILFKEQVGKCIDDLALLPLAKDAAAECKGLPIALVTVGLALQNETSIRKWEDSLSQLRRGNPTDFEEVRIDVYNPLKLSYDYLGNVREKYLFLLCCLFPEDDDIPVEQLTWCSMGLRLFDGISNMKGTRNRTHSLVDKLKSRFLLIDGSDKLHVKMHDVIRDVAIYIGSKEENGFLKSLTSIESSSDDNCNWMSVDISNEQMEVPVLSRFPKLRLLMLRKSKWSFNELSDGSFEGMKELNVLIFGRASIGSLPPTLGSLENLQTLCLFHCQVQNISVIGKLTSLKILNCYGCAKITELPAEIGNLSGLRLLELSYCELLQRIPFGVISSLRRLEELKMRGSFSRWEAEENGKERRNASLTELGSLPNLSCLEIEIDDCTLSAQEICLSQNLVKYYIRIGSVDDDYYFSYFMRRQSRDSEKVMILKFPSYIGAVGKWIEMQVRNTECLLLVGDGSAFCQGLENPNLTHTEIEELPLVCHDQKTCCHFVCNPKDVSFSNLKSIKIRKCDNLRSLFSVSAARRCLLQLEVLEIHRCQSMEQVFWNEGTDDNTDDGCIEFPKLKGLSLTYLPKLTAFCQGLENIIIKFPNLTRLEIGGLPKLNSVSPLNSETLVCHHHTTSSLHFVCYPKVEMGGLKVLKLWLLGNNIKNIWCHQIQNNVFNNLETLDISFMYGIRSLMSTSIAINLVTLKDLRIGYCNEMVDVIERDDDDKQVVDDTYCLFPNLKTLNINKMDKLRRFWQWNHALELPLLEEVSIERCPVMETFTLGSINTPNIRVIKVNDKKMDDQKDLNDVIRHIWTKSQDTSKVDGDRNGNEDKDESEDESNNENVNKDKDERQRWQ